MGTIDRRSFIAAGAAGLTAPALVRMPALSQSRKIRIGIITQLSGFAQAYGYANRSGAEIAVERINKEGGVDGQMIELVLRDDRGTTDGAVAAFRELSGDGIKLLIGGPISGPLVAVGPMVDKTDILFLAAGGGSLPFTHENYNPNLFRVMYTIVSMYSALAYAVAKSNPAVRKWSAIGSDQQVGIELIKVFNLGLKRYYRELHKAEIELAEPVLMKPGAGDFRSQLAQISQSGAEGIFNGLLGTDAITFYKQARAYNLEKSIKVFAEGAAELQLVKALDRNIPENIWSVTPWYADGTNDNPVSRYLLEEYRRRNPNDRFPFGFTGLGHDAIVTYAEAIRAAKSTNTDAIRAAIENGSPAGALGKLTFRKEDHGLLSDITLLRFGSDKSAPEGWKVFEVVRLPSADFIEPATPGQKYVIQ